ncbi:lipopolysaccharide biosynthesis protein [Nonomuraea sp. NPDC046802]|uniref:lipopolysaccharide biosynthesis protein n=1 Tax=Nonomuraea sp. NPDC046802 TaxID=3154919 RepID=UPI0033F4B474
MAAVTRGSVAGVMGAVFSALAQFVLVVVVTRAFPAPEAGAFFTATALSLMAAGVAKLDAGNGLVYVIARTTGYHGISGYIRAALVPCLVAASAAGVLLYPRLGVLAVLLPVMVAGDVLLAATRGFGTMRPTVLLDGLLLPACQLCLVTWAALTGAAEWLPPAWGAPYLLLPILAGAALRHSYRTPRGQELPRSPDIAPQRSSLARVTARGQGVPRSHLPRVAAQRSSLARVALRRPYLSGAARDLWRYTAPRSVAGAIQAVFQRLDVVIVALLAGPAQAAVYTAATRFKVVGQLANQGLAQAVQPRLVRALADGEPERAGELYQTTTAWLVLLTWPVWVAYAALAPWLLTVFGPSYGAAVPVALVLAGTMMVATACGMVDVVLTAAGHTSTSLVNLVVAICCTVALDVALVPSQGAFGAVVGWSAGVLVKNLLPLWQLHRRYGLHPFGRHTLAALRPRTWAAA